MTPIIFDGQRFASEREEKLKLKIDRNRLKPRIGSLVFQEDPASLKYTQLKKRAAVRVGIEFSVEDVSISESLPILQEKIRTFCARNDFHGVMIQKPMKELWNDYFKNNSERMDQWWSHLVGCIDADKDVDCLTSTNLDKVYSKKWKILPATVKAVLTVLNWAYHNHKIFSNPLEGFDLHGVSAIVIGRSEIVGRPLAEVLAQYGATTNLYGSDLDFQRLKQADLVVSATGKPGIITGDLLKEGVVALDVGAPDADFEFESVAQKASFVTPVPNGIGPVTVVSLLENLVSVMERGV